ncbi:Ig-like domain repeat protein [Pseudomonas chlororaphis]
MNTNDFITQDHTLLLSGSLGSALVGDEYVEISLNGGITWLTAAVSGTTWNYNNTGSFLADGTYSVQVRVADVAGNIGQTSVQSVKVDSAIPSATITLDAITTDTGLSSSDFTTSDNTLVFNGSLGAALAADESVQISLDAGTTWSVASVSGMNWTFDHTGTVLADASYNVQARVVDAAGNQSPIASRSVTVDTAAPTSSTTPVFGSITLDLGTSNSDFITLDRTLTFNGTLTSPLTADEALQFSIDGGATWSTTTVSGTNWTFDNTSVSLANNTYTAKLQVVDTAGNIGQTAQQTVVIYNAVPTATVLISGLTTDTGSSASDFVTSDQSLLFSVTLTGTLGANEFVQISLDAGATWHNATLASGSTYVYDNTSATLAEGTYALQARVFDVAGNSSAVVTQSLLIDASAPSTGNTVVITAYTDDVSSQTGSFGNGSQTNDSTPLLTGTVSGLNAGDVLQVYEGATLLGVATVSGGAWSYQLATTTDGSHTYHVVIADAAGNQGTASSNFSFTVDTQAPDVSKTITIDAINSDSAISTDFITNDNSLVFNGALGAALSTDESVQVSLDGGLSWNSATVSGLNWTFDHTGTVLADASYAVQARVVDTAGNVGQMVSQTVVVDTQVPSSGITVSITGISVDTGSSGSDFSTADNTLFFLGQVGLALGPNEHVEISLDNGTPAYDGTTWLTVTNTGATSWSYDNTSTVLPDASYTVRARVVDTAGNIGQTTSQIVNIDSTAATGNNVEIWEVSPDSADPTDFITNVGNLTFIGKVTSPLDVGDTVEVSVDNFVTSGVATVTGLDWSFDNTANALLPGTYTLQARILDVFGNIIQTATETLIIDTTAPSASATVAITTITVDSATVGDFITNDNALVFSGTLGAALGSGEGVRISLDSGATWQDAVVTGTTWSYDNTATALPDDTYTVQAEVFDTAGNIGQSSSITLVIDTSTPTATAAISSIATDTGTGGDFVTSDQSLIINATLTGALSGDEQVQISLDNGVTWNNAALVSGSTYAYDNTANTLAEGSYTFVSRVIDGAGNASSSSSQAVVIDITGPTVGYTLSLDTYTDSVFAQLGNFGTGTSTNDTTPLLNGSVSGLASGDTVRLYEGATLLGLATVSGSTWSYQLGTTTEGSHTYHAVIADAASNEGLTSNFFTLTVDTTAPSETITIAAIDSDSGISTDFNTNDTTLIFSGALGATLPSGYSVQFSLDGGTTYASATVSGTTWSYDNTASALADNTYSLKARVIDAAGNAGPSASQILVVDTSAPTASETIAFTSINQDTGLSSSDYITNDQTLIFNGVLGAPLLAGEGVQIRFNAGSWLNATTTGSTWSYDHTATTLVGGTYTIDVQVVDTAGNVGQSATQVVVVDTSAPSATITIGSITTDTGITTDFKTSDTSLVFNGTLSAPLGAGEGVLFSMDGGTTYVSATVSGTTWSYDNSANTLAEGIYNLKARVSDTAGNYVNTANQSLTVDTTSPSATIAITAINTDSGITTDFITNDTTLTFSGTLGSALAANERVEISLDGGTSWLTATVAGTNWSYDNTANVLASGAYTVIARVIDVADNIGLTTTQVVQIDTVAPSATAAISAINNDAGTSSTDFITSDQTLIVSALLTGTLNSGEKVQISLDNGSTWKDAVLVSGSTYAYDHTATTLTAGSYNFKARVVDTAGNAGTVSAATVVTIDTTAPTMTAVALTGISTDTATGLAVGTGSTTNSATNTDLNTRDPLLTVSGTYVGTLNAGDSLQISIDAGVTWASVTTFSNTTHTWSYIDPVARTSATTYQLRAMDAAGNLATGTTSVVVNVDTTAPVIATLLAPVLTAAFDTGVVGDNITTKTTALTFTSAASGTAEVGATMVLLNDVDNDGKYSEGVDSILGMSTVAAGGTWSVSTAGQAVGNYHLALMLVDAAGNRSALTGTTQLSVVSSDYTTDSSISAYSQDVTTLKLSSGGSWYEFQFVNTLSNDLVWIQSSLSSLGSPTGVITSVGRATAAVFADFQRTGFQGLAKVGATLSGTPEVLFLSANTNDWAFQKNITLTGNFREWGGVVAYDKTGDGYLDFAIGDHANTSLSFLTNTAGVITWMNGTATTGTGRPTGTGVLNNYAEVSAVDLDNNGTVDIVEHTNGGVGDNTTLTTFKNDQLTTNTFVLTNLPGVFQFASTTNDYAMTWADFNNDGFMDLYLNKGASGSSSRILWNDHNGGFGTAAGTTGGNTTYFTDTVDGSGSLAIDWNHDGQMDVIEIPRKDYTNVNVVWYQNQGNGVFSVGANVRAVTGSGFLSVTPSDFNWDGAVDLILNSTGKHELLANNKIVADGTSLHLRIFDANGLGVFYSNTVQLYNSSGTLVSSQIINPQSGLNSNDSSSLVYFYGLSAAETYTAVLLKSVNGVSSDVGGQATLGGNTIEQVNASWTGLTAGLATHNYVLSAEAGSNSASGNFTGTGYNDTFFATAGTDTFKGGPGWQTHYGTPAWDTSKGEDIVDFSLAGSTAITVNLNTAGAQITGFNTVTLTDIEGVIGGAGNDNLTANSTAGRNSLLDGRAGNDTYTISAGGHTLLTFTDINSSDATGGNGNDTAIGFGLGNTNTVTAADVIDLSALLQGYTGTAYVYHDTTTNKDVLDKASEGLMNYLSVTNVGSNTTIAIDRDGTGGTFASTTLLTLNNVTTDLETLLVNHQLIV